MRSAQHKFEWTSPLAAREADHLVAGVGLHREDVSVRIDVKPVIELDQRLTNDVSQPKRTVRGDNIDRVQQSALRRSERETSSRWSPTPATRWSASRARRAAMSLPRLCCTLRIACTTWPRMRASRSFSPLSNFPPQVVVYRKDAAGEEKPLRAIEGDNTKLDAPHGIAVWTKRITSSLLTHGDITAISGWPVQGSGCRPRSKFTRWMPAEMPSLCA